MINHLFAIYQGHSKIPRIFNDYSWLGGSVVERRSLIGELSLVCTGPAADG